MDEPTGVPLPVSAVSVKTGTQLGPYQIEGTLGAGGMGQVYRAVDTRLNRPVAVKIAHEHFGERFEREARAIAQLNHPHICTLYDVGPSYLVMELVDGETLAARLAHGALPMNDVVRYGAQIADALAAAHAKGIVHRDLKPGNVMLTTSGVKVLDFGLAKKETDDTLTRSLVVMGTLAYMAPEQLRGKPADARTDIYALGLILREMATGPQSDDMRGLPHAFAHIVQRCLEADPADRWQAASDVKRELEWTAVEPQQPSAAGRSSARVAWLVAAAAVVGLVSLGAYLRPAATPAAPVTRWSIMLVESGGGERGVALSRDGRLLAYTGRVLPIRPIWVRVLNEADGRPLPGTEGGRRPFFSPDGKWLAYFGSFGRSSLMKVSLEGGAPVRVCEEANFLGGSWGDGDQIVFTTPGGLMRVSGSGGPCEALTDDGDPSRPAHRSPQILPGGKAVLFGIAADGGADETRIAVLDLSTREHRVLDQRGAWARYVPSGHLVYARSGALFAVPFDVDRLVTTGPEVLAVDGVQFGPENGATDYTVSDTGTLVYTSAETAHRTLAWMDRATGTSEATPAPPREYGSVSISPDGRRVATFLTRGGSGILIVDLERGTVTRVSERGSFPVWTPDGRRVVWAQSDGRLFWTAADGSGTPELLTNEPYALVESASPDGRLVSYSVASSAETGARRMIKLFHLPGALAAADPADLKVRPTPGTSVLLSGTATHGEDTARISPDGEWIAYVSDESGTRQVYLRPHGGSGGRVQVSIDGGDEPRWSRNPQTLFYRNRATNELLTVDLAKMPAAQPGRPRAIGTLSTTLWDVAPDGTRFLVVTDPDPEADPATVQVVMNWFEELKLKTAAVR